MSTTEEVGGRGSSRAITDKRSRLLARCLLLLVYVLAVLVLFNGGVWSLLLAFFLSAPVSFVYFPLWLYLQHVRCMGANVGVTILLCTSVTVGANAFLWRFIVRKCIGRWVVLAVTASIVVYLGALLNLQTACEFRKGEGEREFMVGWRVLLPWQLETHPVRDWCPPKSSNCIGRITHTYCAYGMVKLMGDESPDDD